MKEIFCVVRLEPAKLRNPFPSARPVQKIVWAGFSASLALEKIGQVQFATKEAGYQFEIIVLDRADILAQQVLVYEAMQTVQAEDPARLASHLLDVMSGDIARLSQDLHGHVDRLTTQVTDLKNASTVTEDRLSEIEELADELDEVLDEIDGDHDDYSVGRMGQEAPKPAKKTRTSKKTTKKDTKKPAKKAAKKSPGRPAKSLPKRAPRRPAKVRSTRGST